ncbi:MAG TPA: DUF3500 domain-containing protein [Pyrinomonadaceae bacterium]|jgi:hypothetical protein
MKKILIIFGAIVCVSAIGFGIYYYFFSGSTFGTVNVNLGALDEKSVTVCKDVSGHSRIICLSGELKKSLSEDLKSKVQLDYSVANAQKWSNFPPAIYRNRVGVTLDKFNPEQLKIIKAILKEAEGTAVHEGYDELEEILNADDFLKARGSGPNLGYSSGNYNFAFLGTPSDKGVWQLYFGGHHLAVGMTYKDGNLVGATPSFRGVEPFEKFTQNGRENEPMKQEQEAFAAMLNSLDENEKTTAKLTQNFSDIIAGPNKDNNFPSSPSGVKVGNLSKEKQELVIKAIEKYVSDATDSDAKKILEKYRTELADTYISFSGSTDLNAVNDYVRVDGPAVWIELSMQHAIAWSGIHPHSVWRDKTNDYGGNK